MNFLDRLPRPHADGRRFDGDGFDVLHVLATFFGVMLLVLGIAAVVVLVWNSFKVRAEVRALSADVSALRAAQLAPPAGTPADPSHPAVAEAAAEASNAPAPKPKRAPRKKPTDGAE